MAAERHLLLGLLALQNGLVQPAQLVAAFHAWTADKTRSLADHLIALGFLGAAQRSVLEALADLHVAAHGGNVEKSLAALPVGRSTLESLAGVGDPDVERTLTYVGSGSEPGSDPTSNVDADRTGSYSFGSATSEGQRFRVLRPHARGGLGVVYVALDAELNREVALKQILDKHADDPESRVRFLREAEITGGLEHPGIVPVYGLGTYEGGRPFYAMRFIRGDSLREAVDQFHADETLRGDPGARSLELRKLLRRFTDVCNAIDYAHNRGVLHRDIKPGNVIVGKHGETLVVDWGLAKTVGRADASTDTAERTLVPSSASGSSETLPGSALGTPAYMSPEQAEGQIDRLGARSDVYSLGATLYYVLTGQTAVQGDLHEMLRAVKRGDITPPRRYDPSIDPALEAVVMKAMAFRPEDRYATPRALADDVERWMADEPVSAWKEPLSTRARRWARRNRTKVSVAGVALVAGVIGLAVVLVVQTNAKAQIAAALGREQEANIALQAANDDLARSRAAIEARYNLAFAAIRSFHTGVSQEFLLKQNQFKTLRDRLLQSAAAFYEKLGALLDRDTDRASRRALAASKFELAELTEAVGRKEDALAAHRAVLATREALAAEPGAEKSSAIDVGRSLTRIADLMSAVGKSEDSVAVFRRAESILAGVAPPDAESRAALADCRTRLGRVLHLIGRRREALAAYQQARADQEQAAAAPGAGSDARHALAETMLQIGILFWDTRQLSQSETAYRAAIAHFEKLAQDDPASYAFRNRLAGTRSNLGALLDRMNRATDAETEFRAAVSTLQKLAADYPGVTELRSTLASTRYNLAVRLLNERRDAEAEALFRLVLPVRERLVADYPTVTQFRNDLADCYGFLGVLLSRRRQPEEAEAAYRKKLEILAELVQNHGEVTQHQMNLAQAHYDLGGMLVGAGQKWRAEDEYRAALAILKKLADDHPTVTDYRDRLAATHYDLGWVLATSGQPEEAEAEYREAQSIRRKLVADQPTMAAFLNNLAVTSINLGWLLAHTGNLEDARTETLAAQTILQGLARQSPRSALIANQLANTQINLSVVFRRAGQLSRAREQADRAVSVREALARTFPNQAGYQVGLAEALLYRGLTRPTGEAVGAANDYRRAAAIMDAQQQPSPEQHFLSACIHAALSGLAGVAGSGVPAGDGPVQADRAMDLLRVTVASDYREVHVFRNEEALAVLRDRDDFRLLLMDAEMPARVFAPAP